MSGSRTFHSFSHFGTDLREVATDSLGRGWVALRARARSFATRQYLREIDDRMLQDLGISRAQAQFELERPIWDRPDSRHTIRRDGVG